MSNQDLIDYQNVIKANNLTSIDFINQTIVSVNETIVQANSNIASCNAQLADYAQTIATLQNYNTIIDETIAILSE